MCSHYSAAPEVAQRRQCTQAKNRLHHLLQNHNLQSPGNDLFSATGQAWLAQQQPPKIEQLIASQLLAQVDVLEEQIKICEQHITRLAHEDIRVARLMQITGVGLYTAFTIGAVPGDITCFPSSRKLTAYVGLVPREHQSGRRPW